MGLRYTSVTSGFCNTFRGFIKLRRQLHFQSVAKKDDLRILDTFRSVFTYEQIIYLCRQCYSSGAMVTRYAKSIALVSSRALKLGFLFKQKAAAFYRDMI